MGLFLVELGIFPSWLCDSKYCPRKPLVYSATEDPLDLCLSFTPALADDPSQLLEPVSGIETMGWEPTPRPWERGGPL